jgi:hypothetical protein
MGTQNTAVRCAFLSQALIDRKRCGHRISSGFQILHAETAAAGTFAKTLA